MYENVLAPVNNSNNSSKASYEKLFRPYML